MKQSEVVKIKANTRAILDTCIIEFKPDAVPPTIEYHVHPSGPKVSEILLNPDRVNETLRDVMNSCYKWICEINGNYYLSTTEEEVIIEEPDCVCGAESINNQFHSQWCDKYKG